MVAGAPSANAPKPLEPDCTEMLRRVSLFAEVDDLGRSGYPCGSGMCHFGVGLLKAVFDEQVQIVALVKDLAMDIGVVFPEQPHLAVLLGNQLLAHRGDLYVDIILWKVEIGPEIPRGFAVIIPLECKRTRFVLPVDTVEIEQPRELSLAVVSELGEIGRRRPEEVLCTQIPDAPERFSSATVPRSWSGNSLCSSPRTSSCTGRTAIPKTP